MSYDIRLVNKNTREVIMANFKNDCRCGTYCISDSPIRPCEFNITFNYSEHFYRLIDADEGIRKIYGMTAKDSIPILQSAILSLADDVDEDYWKPTQGNAKEALKGLLAIAEVAPDGVWMGD